MSKDKTKDKFKRHTKTYVKTSKGRKPSSTRWLQRQLNDPYVHEAKSQGYRSRAAFKLIELDERFKFLKRGANVVDLGAAPGGWSQVALKKIGDKGTIIALDLQDMDAIQGVTFIKGDFEDDDVLAELESYIEGPIDIVLSDMAPFTIGHRQTDHIRIAALAELALDFAKKVLKKDGTLVMKMFQGGSSQKILLELKKHFRSVRHAKPPASRQDSSEMFVIAMGFKG